jgi:Zn-dependent protease
MKWSFKLGRFLGIDVFVHFTFLIVLAIVGPAHWLPQGSLMQAFGGMVFFALLFLCVLLHEYGHALMARRFDVGTRDITLLPIGGVARLERIGSLASIGPWELDPATGLVTCAAQTARGSPNGPKGGRCSAWSTSTA